MDVTRVEVVLPTGSHFASSDAEICSRLNRKFFAG